jgi:hypothetical protein
VSGKLVPVTGETVTDVAAILGYARASTTGQDLDAQQGSKLVRWAAIEAVQRQQTTAKISADKDRIEARRGKNIAKVAAARKLLTLVYYGLRDGHIRALDRARVA